MELVIKLFCYHDPAHAPPLLGGRRGQGYRLFSAIFYHKHERTCLGFIVRIQEGFDIAIAHTQMKCHCACTVFGWTLKMESKYLLWDSSTTLHQYHPLCRWRREPSQHPWSTILLPSCSTPSTEHWSFSPYCQGLLREVSFIVRFLILWYF